MAGQRNVDRGLDPRAACRQAQPDELFVRGAEQNKAKQLCTGCPVRTECLAEALDNQIEWGVWGGMTERERRALLRRRPNASWRAVLEAARTKAEQETRSSLRLTPSNASPQLNTPQLLTRVRTRSRP
jgi:WhiB family redox-sensing transcriptional regulator